MKLLPLFFLGFAGIVAQAEPPDTPPAYSQTYAIFIKGSMSGTEVVTESVDDEGNTRSDSEHEIFVTDGLETKRMAFVTSMVLSKKDLSPLRYSSRYTSGSSRDSYEVVFKDGAAFSTIIRSGHKFENKRPLQPNGIVLDFNVYHQYDFMVRKYDFKKAGPQTLADFIPLIGNEVSVMLEFLGNGTLKSGKTEVPVRNFKINFLGIGGGNFSVDKNGRLVRLLMPMQDLEVIKRELVPSPNE
jgi:hypothetical protein